MRYSEPHLLTVSRGSGPLFDMVSVEDTPGSWKVLCILWRSFEISTFSPSQRWGTVRHPPQVPPTKRWMPMFSLLGWISFVAKIWLETWPAVTQFDNRLILALRKHFSTIEGGGGGSQVFWKSNLLNRRAHPSCFQTAIIAFSFSQHLTVLIKSSPVKSHSDKKSLTLCTLPP